MSPLQLLAASGPAPGSWLDRVLSLHDLSTAGQGVQVQLARAWPPWVWALIVLACAVFAAWSYWRIMGPRSARTAFGILRAVTLVFLALLIAGPQLVRQNERVEKDWVVLLADRSRSMQIADAPASALNTSSRVPRETQLESALAGARESFKVLREKREVLSLGFDQGTFDLPIASNGAYDLGPPNGDRTAIGTALEQALQRSAGRPVAGVVLLSDGRSFDQPSRAVLQELAERQIPVYVFPLGSSAPIADLAVTRVDAPTASFVGDLVPVTVDVDRLGATESSQGTGGKVRLVASDGTVLDEKSLPTQASGASRLTLTTRAKTPGRQDWRIELALDTPDLSADNNAQKVSLELVDKPIRVVYFDGYPRWEYRYLKNLILREKSFRSSNLLLASDRRYIQEGTDRLETLPRSGKDWSAFDVILIGDVRPGLFTREQLDAIRAQVSERGAGLLLIGGASFTPDAWTSTPLADLLPFTLATGDSPSGSSRLPVHRDPVLISPGPGAAPYGVLQLGESSDEPWPTTLTDPALKWNAMRWAQRIEPGALKPSTEVLALATPLSVDGSTATPTPLVMTMRYGAGRVVYVATDETWRYRYGRGETLTERFWIPVLRLLARGSLGRTGQKALLAASPEQALVQQPVRITLKLLDQSLIQRGATGVSVRIAPDSGDRSASAESITLSPERPADLPSGESMVATFAGTWVPAQPGMFRVTSEDPLLAGLELATRVDVVLPEDELRRPQADHQALTDLATATGGRVLTTADLSKLGDLLPNRELRILGTPDIETLWDKPIVFALLLALLASEWVGRRLIKLA